MAQQLTGLLFGEAQRALQRAAARRDVVNNAVPDAPPPVAPPSVEVPKLTGMSFNEATQVLQRIGLAVARNDAVNNTVAAGQVMAQTPAAAAKIAPQSTVTLIVAKHEVPQPPQAIAIVDFAAPQVNGVALDICREWGANCGKPAADAFCVARGFAAATDFRIAQDSPPSRVIGTGQICREKFCDRISWVRCTKTSGQAKAVPLDPAMMARNEAKRSLFLR